MATTTEILGIHSVPPPVNGSETAAEPKRPRGRPMKCKQCGENIDPRGHTCTPPPAAAEEPTGDEDFWITISNFTPEEWNHLTAYLYRVMPRIDRKANGKPINLGCYSTAFTREDIMQEHGSGVYRIDVTQTEQASSRSRRIAREVFTIINPKYPPIVPPGDWVDDKVNDMWKWGAPPGVQSTGVAGVGYPPGFNIKDVYDSAFQMAKQLTPPPPPPKDDAVLTTLLTKLLDASLKPAPPPPAPLPVDTTATDRLFKMMETQLAETRTELRDLRNKATAPPPAQKNLLEQIKEIQPAVLGFMDMMGDRSGKTEWWNSPMVEKLADGIAESFPLAMEMIKNSSQSNPARPQPNPWTQQPNGIPAAQPQAQAAAPPPQGPPPATAATEPQPDQPELTEQQKLFQAAAQKWGGFILFVSQHMVAEFKKDEEGHGGYYFRDWLLEMHGRLRWADLRREVGPVFLASMIAQHPGLSAEMGPEEARVAFVNDFFTVPGEEPDGQDDQDGDEEKVIDIGGAE